MAEDAEIEDSDGPSEDALEGGKKGFLSKKMLMILAPVVLLVIGGGGAALMGVFSSKDKSHDGDEVAHYDEAGTGGHGDDHGAEHSNDHGEGAHDKAKRPKDARKVQNVDIPDILVNLNTGTTKNSFLKLKVSLEVDGAVTLEELEAQMPRVLDHFQIYLRELRLEDLSGSAGMFRLKEELLRRVNRAVYPTKVYDVLFREMLVQ
ncbi:MAG: flagellar basal body-associated FliL family protein [Pseudomonadota bacterium]